MIGGMMGNNEVRADGMSMMKNVWGQLMGPPSGIN
jgi:hypothetical protein